MGGRLSAHKFTGPAWRFGSIQRFNRAPGARPKASAFSPKTCKRTAGLPMPKDCSLGVRSFI